MPAPSRQTLSYIQRRLSEVGLRPTRRFGQNFLIDLNLLELLASAAEIGPQDVVLEVGTGMGGLTGLLAAKAAHVITVEIDPHLQQLAREELEPFSNIEFLNCDALYNKNRLNPQLVSAVVAALPAGSARRFKVAANLPYCIATPVLALSLTLPVVPHSLTVTIQKELADRITADPGTKDYSALSVWIQSLCEVELIRVLAPSVFWPRPQVESAFLQLRTDPVRAALTDLEGWHRFVRDLFLHRRKYLRAAAVSALRDQLDKPQIDEILDRLAFGPQARRKNSRCRS